MNKIFTKTLLDLGDDSRIKSIVLRQETMLARIICTDEKFGKWIDDFDLPFLEEVLSLNDEDFREDFPEMNLTAEDRAYLRSGIARHVTVCPHCKLKIDCDVELDDALQHNLNLPVHHGLIAGHA